MEAQVFPVVNNCFLSMKDLKTFGARLKWLRSHLGLSLQEFGDRCGVGRSYVSKLESGASRNPSLELTNKVCQEFGVRSEWLLSGTSDPFVEAEVSVRHVQTSAGIVTVKEISFSQGIELFIKILDQTEFYMDAKKNTKETELSGLDFVHFFALNGDLFVEVMLLDKIFLEAITLCDALALMSAAWQLNFNSAVYAEWRRRHEARK